MNTVASIKTATQAAINRIGSIDAAASVVRVGRSQLSEYQSRNYPAVVPVDVAIVLDEFAQEPLILGAMAHAAGYTLTPLHLGHGDVAEIMEGVACNAGLTMATTIRVLADGIIMPDEAADLSRDLAKLQRVVTHALQVVHAKAQGVSH
ncbi:hypothetical protein [Gluconobacter albidus]|uniref:XRE family transcriptional regulator n=1 Tax=Gluconobacter albidus TaxID=318683 RepID=A0AAW3QYB9_9PROT|nr:hypothetical protein [Gluconobacter albidus]KXV38241.1 hypothetical protein AD941_06875 [Gluconobacter albidus]GBQ93805.1 hypothetical protein AA3250_2919 [Gluconobacter albidus NBRC 3250]GLQ68942.1 hypothetical protein GCM10007866_13930 [Gluconobacter albidus]